MLDILDNNYKWLEFYDYNSKVKLTAIGKDNGIPYEDDLYLDVVITSEGEIILLDEDELKDALNRMEITNREYEDTYKEAKKLIDRLNSKKEKLREFTYKYLNLMMEGD